MRYWLNRGSAPEGPFEEGAITQLIARGLRHANVCAEGGQSWQPLAAVPAFATALSTTSLTTTGPSTPAATLATSTTPGPAPTSSMGAVAAAVVAAPSARSDIDPARIAARVAGGLSTPIRWHVLLAVLFLPAAPVLAFLGLANGQYRGGPLIPLVGGVVLLVSAFVVARRRIVADARGIKPVLGVKRLWSEYDRVEDTLRYVWVTSRASRTSTRHPVYGRRFYFRRGAPLLVEADHVATVRRFAAFAKLAASLAQPARAAALLADGDVPGELLETDRAPRLGGALVALPLALAGVVCVGVAPVAYSIGQARVREVYARHDAEVAARAAAVAAEEAASAPTYPASPGLGALTADAVCPLLEGWGEHCTNMGTVASTHTGAPAWLRYWVGTGPDLVTLEIVDFGAAGTAHRVLDRSRSRSRDHRASSSSPSSTRSRTARSRTGTTSRRPSAARTSACGPTPTSRPTGTGSAAMGRP